jgi:melibiose permease
VVDYGVFKFGTRNESIVFSVQPMVVKFAAAFAGAFVGFGLALVGYDADLAQQTEGTKAGITVMTVGLPIIAAILGFIIYKRYYKLNGSFHDEVLHSLYAAREVPTAGGFPL